MRNSKGFTLIEFTLALIAVSIILFCLLVIYPKMTNSNKVDQEIRNISMLAIGINSFYQGQANYSTVNNKNMINASVVPDIMKLQGKDDKGLYSLSNVWKGEVVLSSASKQIGLQQIPYALYSIKYESVPSDDCIRIIAALKNNKFYWVEVNQNPVISQTHVYDIKDVAEQCNKFKVNELIFYGI